MMECSHDIIFGWDFFKATEAVIDCGRNELHLGETSVLESREEENQRLIQVVKEFERAVIFRLGHLRQGGARGPGLFFVLPFTDRFLKVDLRTVSTRISSQTILTKDSVTVVVDAVVFYRVFDACSYVIKVNHPKLSTIQLAATTVRTELGAKTLSEILTEQSAIGSNITEIMNSITAPWGITVERVEIKDVLMPKQLQRSMASVAEASREARAKYIAAEGELKASKAFKEAAEMISDAPAAIQLRYLQTLTTVATERNHTIVFPLPIELFSKFLDMSKMFQSEGIQQVEPSKPSTSAEGSTQ
ncbi:hypothetical protein LAZ67_10003249 [Cordylochernes scorpioides]|uniref:Band 7 domain-containing protein n=1 Tax=Cordylochernes scorpioides TaxID=51811 RepID=A0ABY6KX53_9ARAC|nr:hypothetical protein LAZ67_10003249 [Cordylochernes scorpioides]